MFWTSPSRTIEIIIILLILSAFVSGIVYFKTRKKMLSIFTFSLLSYFTFYLSAGSRIFAIYNLKWIVKFTLIYWPWINLALFILLIIKYFRNKKNEKNKNN